MFKIFMYKIASHLYIGIPGSWPGFRRLGTPMPKIGLFRSDPMLFLPRVATYMPKMANLGELTCLFLRSNFEHTCLIRNFGKNPPLKMETFACKFPM